MDTNKIKNILQKLIEEVKALRKRVEELEAENKDLQKQLEAANEAEQLAQKEATFLQTVLGLIQEDIIEPLDTKIAALREIYYEYGEEALRKFIQGGSISRDTVVKNTDPIVDIMSKLL